MGPIEEQRRLKFDKNSLLEKKIKSDEDFHLKTIKNSIHGVFPIKNESEAEVFIKEYQEKVGKDYIFEYHKETNSIVYYRKEFEFKFKKEIPIGESFSVINKYYFKRIKAN